MKYSCHTISTPPGRRPGLLAVGRLAREVSYRYVIESDACSFLLTLNGEGEELVIIEPRERWLLTHLSWQEVS